MNSTGAKASADVKATVEVKPTRSQALLVAAAIVAGIAIICGMVLFLSNQPLPGTGFVLFAAVIFCFIFWGWSKSQSDVDLEQSHPTSLIMPDGTQVTTDSRTLRSIEGLQGLARICQEVLHRKPLPQPNGLVDEKLQVIPDSEQAAITMTHQINSDTQSATNVLVDALQLGEKKGKQLIEQPNSESFQEPPNIAAQKFNAAMQDGDAHIQNNQTL